MRKVLLVVAVFPALMLLTPRESNALTWEFGFRGGVSVSHFTGADKDSLGGDVKPGLTGGLYLKSNVNDKVGFRIELNAVQKGTREQLQEARLDPDNNVIVIADIDRRITLNYVEVPLLFVFTDYSEDHHRRLGLYGGPAFSYLMSSKLSQEFGDETEENIDIGGVPFDQLINTTDITLMLGFEGYFRIGTSNFLTLDLRYTYSFNSIIDSGKKDWDIRNSSFQVMMGVMWPLGEEPLPEGEVEPIPFDF